MSYKRKLKHEFVILDKKGVIILNSESFSDIWGSHTDIHDAKSQGYKIVSLKKGYLIPWDAIEDRYNFLNEQFEAIKKRIELLGVIRMKRDENLEDR